MLTVRLMLDYMQGPIWVLNSDGISVWKHPLIKKRCRIK